MVFGQEGLVGKSLLSQLKNSGHKIINVSRKDLDLTSEIDVNKWFAINIKLKSRSPRTNNKWIIK